MDGGEERNNQGNMTKRGAGGASPVSLLITAGHHFWSSHSEMLGLASTVCVEDLKDT